MNPPDDEKRKIIEAALGMKDIAEAKSFGNVAEAFDEIQAGSPRTPGYEADYGQTMKDTPKMSSEPDPIAIPLAKAESLADSTPADSRASEFDKALEAIQQQGQEQGKAKDLEH
jgi:hypothetical protein